MTPGLMKCPNCAGRIPMPTDPTAMTARCPYCAFETLLPAPILEDRRRMQAMAFPLGQDEPSFFESAAGAGPQRSKGVLVTVALAAAMLAFVVFWGLNPP